MNQPDNVTRARPRRATILAVLALGAVVVGGLTQLKLDTSTESFLPSGDRVEKALAEKADHFGGDPLIVVLETKKPRALFTDQEALLRLAGLEGQLASLRDVAAVYGPGTVLNQTAGAAQDMLAQISGRRDGYRNQVMAEAKDEGLSAGQVKERGKAALARFDRRYGSLVVQGLPAGLPTLKNPRFVQTVLFDEETLEARPQWRYLVPSPTTVTILVRPRADLDAAATARLVDGVRDSVNKADLDLSRTTVTGSPAIAAGLADRGRAELPILGAVAVAAVGLIFFASSWSRRRRARLRPVVAALIGTLATLACFGWIGRPVSLGVVAFLPILMGIGSDFPLYWSRGRADKAVIVTACAAAVGFGSLAFSPLPFVRELGVALALGLGLTVLAAVVMRRMLGVVPQPELDPSRLALFLSRRWSAKARVLLAGAVVATTVLGWATLVGLDVEAQPDRLAAGLPELEDAQYAEDLLGSSGEVSIVIKGSKVTDPGVLAWSRRAQDTIVTELGDRVHPVLSVPDLLRFVGDEPTTDQVDAAVAAVPAYLSSAVLKSDQSEALIVLGVEFDDVKDLGVLLDEIDEAIGDPPAGIHAEAVGLPVSAVRGLELVGHGRVLINVVGIGLAFGVILIGLRSLREAIRAVLTVVVAAGWIALLASATTGSLNPLTVAVGSLVTATGCEFAVMLRRGREVQAVATAALAGTVGYLTLALSGLAVLRDFGLLLAASVVCSFVAAVVLDRLLWPNDAWSHQPAATVNAEDDGRVAQHAPKNAVEVLT
jgi:predicted RND superfamily exporter protein